MIEVKRNLINVTDNSRHKYSDMPEHDTYNIHVCLECSGVSLEDVRNTLKNISHGSFEYTMLNMIEAANDNLVNFKIKFIFANSYGFELITLTNSFSFKIINLQDTKKSRIKNFKYDNYTYSIIEKLSVVKNNLSSISENIDTVLERLLNVLIKSLTDNNELDLNVYDEIICKREKLVPVENN